MNTTTTTTTTNSKATGRSTSASAPTSGFVPGHLRTPLWRRITSLLSLVSLVVIGGFVVAALLCLAAVGLLLALDAAVG